MRGAQVHKATMTWLFISFSFIRALVKSFFVTSQLFTSLEQFGELSEEVCAVLCVCVCVYVCVCVRVCACVCFSSTSITTYQVGKKQPKVV